MRLQRPKKQLMAMRKLKQSFIVLANSEGWLADNHQNAIRVPEQDPNGATLPEE